MSEYSNHSQGIYLRYSDYVRHFSCFSRSILGAKFVCFGGGGNERGSKGLHPPSILVLTYPVQVEISW